MTSELKVPNALDCQDLLGSFLKRCLVRSYKIPNQAVNCYTRLTDLVALYYYYREYGGELKAFLDDAGGQMSMERTEWVEYNWPVVESLGSDEERAEMVTSFLVELAKFEERMGG